MAAPIFALSQPEELTEDLYGFLKSTDSFDSSGITTPQILEMVKKGDVQLFVYWSGDAKGVVATRLQSFQNGRELFVWRIGGIGLIEKFAELEKLIHEFAVLNGVDRIRTYSQNHRYETTLKIMLGLGWMPESLEMIKEV